MALSPAPSASSKKSTANPRLGRRNVLLAVPTVVGTGAIAAAVVTGAIAMILLAVSTLCMVLFNLDAIHPNEPT
jgi:hypothetical protein